MTISRTSVHSTPKEGDKLLEVGISIQFFFMACCFNSKHSFDKLNDPRQCHVFLEGMLAKIQGN